MGRVEELDQIYSKRARKKFGLPNLWGASFFGVTEFGDDRSLFGVYSRRRRGKTVHTVQMPHMWPKNPQTGTQQAWRDVFAGGVAEWHLLTNDEKIEYNNRADRYQLQGFCLFMREYLHMNYPPS